MIILHMSEDFILRLKAWHPISCNTYWLFYVLTVKFAAAQAHADILRLFLTGFMLLADYQ